MIIMRNRSGIFNRITALLLVVILMLPGAVSSPAEAAERTVTLLFTHDMHDYYYPTTSVEEGEILEHGGAARLKTLIDKNSDENTLYIDGGDFSMGTLYQAIFSEEAPELRGMGEIGCFATTFGNHEFDYGAGETAKMLRAALASGEKLPYIVQSNIVFEGNLTDEQKELRDAFNEYGVKEYLTTERNGYKIGIFGLSGYDSIECTQTELSYIDYKEAAKNIVKKLKAENCDIIIALSHAGTSGDGENGEDFELAAEVPEIDVILSAHTHSSYSKPVMAGNTLIMSAGEYLYNLGKVELSKENGVVKVENYSLIPIDSTVAEDAAVAERFEGYKKLVENGYLAGSGLSFDQVIAHSNMNLQGVNEMYASHQEYQMGDIIADSYIYEAEKNGITDVDVAVVGLGTIRSSIKKGDITVADAFEICSLGVGSDKSAGHPLVAVYISGKEMKLLTELDASLGPIVSSVKMSYSGACYKFNTKRIILDRVTDVKLQKRDGSLEEFEDDRLYKVVANMYAINMLGMLNGLTKGILSITTKYADGTPVEDPYTAVMRDKNGQEIKEWTALTDYLGSFEKNADGVSELPEKYSAPLGRKVKYEEGGWARVSNPGVATNIMQIALLILLAVLIVLITVIVLIVKRIRRRRRIKKAIKAGTEYKEGAANATDAAVEETEAKEEAVKEDAVKEETVK